MKARKQFVCLGDRFRANRIAQLHDDLVMNGRRLKIVQKDKTIGCVIFKGTTERDYYNAMQRLSKRIGSPIQYIFLYPPMIEEEVQSVSVT